MVTENNNENEQEQEVNTPEFIVKEVGFDDNDSNEIVLENQNEEEEEGNQEEEEIEDNQEDNDEDEIFELNEEEAFKFLKESRGLEVDSIEDLLNPKGSKKLSPTAEKFQEYVEKTGNESVSDFLSTQKDWSKEEPEEVLKQLLKNDNPTLSREEIDFLFNEKYSYDEDSYDDADKMRKGINKKVDLQKALTFLDKQKEEYMVHRGSEDNIPEVYKKTKESWDQLQTEFSHNEQLGTQRRNDFISTTEQVFTNDFEGFKTKIGDSEYVVKPADIAKTRDAQMDIKNFQQKFFDENEKLIDPVGYHKALYFAMNSDKMAEHYFNLGKSARAEQEEMESKNIPLQGMKSADKPIGQARFTVREV